MRTIANPKTRVALEMIDPQPMSAVEISNTYATIASPALTGTPTAPTANISDAGSNQIATTKYVKDSISNLVGTAPSTLDTLGEIASALEDNNSVTNTLVTTIGNKLDTNSANYVKSLSISGTTITVTKGNNSTSTLKTQDTTYTAGTGITISSNTSNGVTTRTISADSQLPSVSNQNNKFLKVVNGTPTWSADNDTHYKASLVLGASNATANVTTDTSNPYLNIIENSSKSSSIQIKGSGATSVKSNGSTITISSTNTTYSAFNGSGTGLVPSRSGSTTTRYLREDGSWSVPPDTNTTYSLFPTSGSSGSGLVPYSDGSTTKFLRADRTWRVIPNVSTSAPGLAPTSPGGTTKYLRADGQWVVPPDTNTTYTAASATPKAPGTAAVGSSAKYAREDHVHPLQTTITGNAASATKLATARTITVKITLNGNTLTASGSFDGSGNLTLDLGSLTSAQLTGGSSSGGCSGCSCSGECNSREYEGCCCDCAGE